MNTPATTILPKGYLQDAAGRLVPVDTVKAIDIERDKLVAEIVAKAKVLSNQIATFKGAAFGDIGAFVELSAEQYGTRVGGNKGNVTLMSFDGRYKVLRAISEHLRFDERLMAAKALIDECIHDWAQGSTPELQVLVNDAFNVDKQGNINTVRVLALRRLEIADERWQLAMKAISESIQVVGSKTYLRIYERDAKGEYQPIALDVSTA
jgi:hypothetical protein